MITELNEIIKLEKSHIQKLLNTLEKQHGYIIKNDIFSLESIVEEINICNKDIAKYETERRKFTQGNSMSDFVNEYNNEELENNYRDIKKLLEETKLQKDTNELLIKQSLVFTNKMLNVLNPNREIKTYNSYGKVGRY